MHPCTLTGRHAHIQTLTLTHRTTDRETILHIHNANMYTGRVKEADCRWFILSSFKEQPQHARARTHTHTCTPCIAKDGIIAERVPGPEDNQRPLLPPEGASKETITFSSRKCNWTLMCSLPCLRYYVLHQYKYVWVHIEYIWFDLILLLVNLSLSCQTKLDFQ